MDELRKRVLKLARPDLGTKDLGRMVGLSQLEMRRLMRQMAADGVLVPARRNGKQPSKKKARAVEHGPDVVMA